MANLKIDNISFSIGGTQIIKDITLQVPNKKFVGIIGPNGCGKSTLLKNIYRVYKQDKGIVYIDDKNINRFSSKERAKKMAVVAQEANHQFDFTVKDMVLMGRYAHKRMFDTNDSTDLEITDEVLEKMGMDSYADRSFLTLSGGEKQRVLIARALAQESRVIILDEPTNHLDIKYQLQIMSAVKKENITTLAAIHDFNIAAMYCDYLYVMKDGEIIGYGTPKEVLTERMFKEIFDVEAHISENPHTGKVQISFMPYDI